MWPASSRSHAPCRKFWHVGPGASNGPRHSRRNDPTILGARCVRPRRRGMIDAVASGTVPWRCDAAQRVATLDLANSCLHRSGLRTLQCPATSILSETLPQHAVVPGRNREQQSIDAIRAVRPRGVDRCDIPTCLAAVCFSPPSNATSTAFGDSISRAHIVARLRAIIQARQSTRRRGHASPYMPLHSAGAM